MRDTVRNRSRRIFNYHDCELTGISASQAGKESEALLEKSSYLEMVEYREEESLEISVEEQDGRLAIEEEEIGRLDDALFGIAEVRDTD